MREDMFNHFENRMDPRSEGEGVKAKSCKCE